MIVNPFLPAIPVMTFLFFWQILFGHDHSAGIRRIERIFDVYGDSYAADGKNRLGMKHFRAHIRKFAKFAITEIIGYFGIVDYTRICGEKAVNVRPVFINIRSDGTRNECAGYVRSAARKRGYFTVLIRAVKTRYDGILDVFETFFYKV